MLPTHSPNKLPPHRRRRQQQHTTRKFSLVHIIIFIWIAFLLFSLLYFLNSYHGGQRKKQSHMETAFSSGRGGISDDGERRQQQDTPVNDVIPQQEAHDENQNANWLQKTREKFSGIAGKKLPGDSRHQASSSSPQDNSVQIQRIGTIDYKDTDVEWEDNLHHLDSLHEDEEDTEFDFYLKEMKNWDNTEWEEYEKDWKDDPTPEDLDSYSKQSLKSLVTNIIEKQNKQSQDHAAKKDDMRLKEEEELDEDFFRLLQEEMDDTSSELGEIQPESQHKKPPSYQLSSEQKAARIKEAFLHAWKGYSTFAWGKDEINPVTNGTNNSWGGFGATLVDSLDTLYIMGLSEEFEKAKDFVRRINFNSDVTVSFFETTIRHLGGLLSAYDLSGDRIFLQKASELADRMLPAFDSPSGLPYHEVNLKTGRAANPSWTNRESILSEVGSFQLEWKYLSHHTGKTIYWKKAVHAMKVIRQNHLKHQGLYPLFMDIRTGNFTDSKVSWGGLGDSFYEYELKQYLLTNKKQSIYRRMYSESVAALEKHLLKRSQPSHHLFVGEMESSGHVTNKFEHLACFIPGMLVLGSQEIKAHKKDYKIAVDLLETCVALYTDQPTGLAPDSVRFSTQANSRGKDYSVMDPKYMLRPETVESLYYMYYYTGSKIWTKLAWRIFLNLERHCKTDSAFSGVKDVTQMGKHVKHDSSMQSFFLAETLKYLYLLFTPKTLDLSKIVFNTEAHILSRFDKGE